MQLTVEETPEGVLLKPVPAFAKTRAEDVFGCLHYEGAPKSPAGMEKGILAEARRRHVSD